MNITRQDMATMIDRYLNVEKINLPAVNSSALFKDSSKISSYAASSVARVKSCGLINGKPGNIFDPLSNSSRGEMAQILSKLLTLTDKTDKK